MEKIPLVVIANATNSPTEHTARVIFNLIDYAHFEAHTENSLD
jgi:hypothetical protein